jgi:hypothetical protein
MVHGFTKILEYSQNLLNMQHLTTMAQDRHVFARPLAITYKMQWNRYADSDHAKTILLGRMRHK